MEKETSSKRTFSRRAFVFVFVFLAWTANAVLRVYFAYLSMTGVQLLDVQVSQSVTQILSLSFLSLGVAGLFTSVGLWLNMRWGTVGTMLVSVATIVFDVWGLTIQLTAVLGFIVPVIAIVYLLAARRETLVPKHIIGGGPSVPIGGI